MVNQGLWCGIIGACSRGIRSPLMLFVLVIDTLNKFFARLREFGLLRRLTTPSHCMRTILSSSTTRIG